MQYDACNCPNKFPIRTGEWTRKRDHYATEDRLHSYIRCLYGTQYDHFLNHGPNLRHQPNDVWSGVMAAIGVQYDRYMRMLPVDWKALESSLPPEALAAKSAWDAKHQPDIDPTRDHYPSTFICVACGSDAPLPDDDDGNFSLCPKCSEEN